jgi:hypothetical protein
MSVFFECVPEAWPWVWGAEPPDVPSSSQHRFLSGFNSFVYQIGEGCTLQVREKDGRDPKVPVHSSFTCPFALCLVENGLIGKFTRIWPSLRVHGAMSRFEQEEKDLGSNVLDVLW